jgi:hypothetical protein
MSAGTRTATACSTPPGSIFEDALNETWILTCTTTVTEDTTKVVTAGTPIDPAGESLCQPARGWASAG